MNYFPGRLVTADKISRYSGVEVSAIYETIRQGVFSGIILSIGEQEFYLTEQFRLFKDSLLANVTGLLENDLLKKSVNIEELRNRFGKFRQTTFSKRSG